MSYEYDDRPWVIYLLCFDEPYQHARHYLGSTPEDRLQKRMQEHGTASGARLLRVVREAGIGWTLVRLWRGDRKDERRLKQQGGHSRLCPRCRGLSGDFLSLEERTGLRLVPKHTGATNEEQGIESDRPEPTPIPGGGLLRLAS